MIWTYLNPDWLMMLMIFWRVRQSDYQLRAICCWPSSIGVLLIHILRYSWYWLLSWQVGIGGIPLRKSRPVEVWYIYIYIHIGDTDLNTVGISRFLAVKASPTAVFQAAHDVYTMNWLLCGIQSWILFMVGMIKLVSWDSQSYDMQWFLKP